MKHPESIHNTSDCGKHTLQESEAQLRSILRSELPGAPADEWFLPKVMNRLPEKRQGIHASILEKICYAASAILLIAAWIYAIVSTTANGISQITFVMAAILPVVTLFCIGIFTLPAIRRSL